MNALSARDNRLARESAVAAAAKPPVLNPPFPYRLLPFSEADFRVADDPAPSPIPPVDSPQKT